MKYFSLVALLLILACSVAGPSIAATGRDEAVSADARAWLSLIDSGRYRESRNEASAFFKKVVSEKTWRDSLTGIRNLLGKPVSRRMTKTISAQQLPGAPDGHYLIMVFETTFGNKKNATETVTFMLEANGRWKAAGYYVR